MIEQEIKNLRLSNPKGYSSKVKSNKEMVEYLDGRFPLYKGNVAAQVTAVVLDLKESPRCYCGNKVAFASGKFKTFCSCSCAGKYNAEKNKRTKLERYGAANYNNKEKYIATCLERYGRANIFQGEEGKDFVKERSLEKYGVENPHQAKQVIEKTKATNMKRYGKTIPADFHARNKSKGELEVYDYCKSITSYEVISGSRSVIAPLELDIYIPELKLGIEYDGDYWHSLPALQERDKRKDLVCKERGIKLIRISESQWHNDNSTVKNMLKEHIC